MFDVTMLVADAMRDIDKRDGEYLKGKEPGFNASFIVGGQIGGEPLRLFRIYAEGNFIEADVDTPYFQTGEIKYGKPIIDRVITPSTPLADAAKCVLVSSDSTMRSNLSVGMPIDLLCYERDSLEMRYDCPQPTPMIFHLNVHYTRVSDLVGHNDLVFDPPVPRSAYRDTYGNWCTRIVAPQGCMRVTADAIVQDSGLPEVGVPGAQQVPVRELPDDALLFLLGSRYCETDRLTETAWQLFGQTPTGWARVQAICDYVHRHITFGYEHARMTRTALEAFYDKSGVCRDFAHLAVAFCRCMNIPARYCTGYLGDIGMPPPYGTMDFAAWFEVYLSGEWHTFDARNNIPRIGRVLIARGRDAADVAISTTFGSNTLTSFKVWTDEVRAL